MSQYTNSYKLGATIISFGTSTAIQIMPSRGINGWSFKKMSGATLAIVSGTGFSSAQGYIMGDTEVFNISGPATFFLAAGGATVTVGLVPSYTSGTSLFP